MDALGLTRELDTGRRATTQDRRARSAVAILGITTVADGIETADQAKRMAALGCTYGQSFFYARPLEQAEIDTGVAGATAVRRQRRRGTDGPPAATHPPREARAREPRLVHVDPTAA